MAPCPSRDTEAGLARRSSACGSRRARPIRRLRPEKTRGVARGRGFDSRHLQERSGVSSERCWGWLHASVSSEDLLRPRHGVLNPDPAWLRADPKLEILGAIVVPDAVSVMHTLVCDQVTTNRAFHYEDVLEDVAIAGSGMTRHPDHDISGLVPRVAAPQFPLCSAPYLRHAEHLDDFTCFGLPQAQELRDRHQGQRRCRLEGTKARPHCRHAFTTRAPVLSEQVFGSPAFFRSLVRIIPVPSGLVAPVLQ